MDFPLNLVNPFQGTRSGPEFSRGSTVPLIQQPLASTAWSLVTGDDPWPFHPDVPKLRSLRCLPAGFEVCPQTGPLVTDPARRASAYRLDTSVVAPHRLTTEFLRYRVAVDLAPTPEGAVLRTTWAQGGVARLLWGSGGGCSLDEASGEVRGAGVGGGPGFRAALDTPVVRSGREGQLLWTEFDVSRGAVIEVRVATGDSAFPVGSLDEITAKGAEAWSRLLGRFVVEGGTEAQRRTFYSCLYRVLCVAASSAEVSRTVAPLFALAYRDELPSLLPLWAGATDGPVVIAEALAQGLPVDPALAETALESPADPDSSVSAVLDQAYLDWCRGRIVRALNRPREAVSFEQKAQIWQNLFDASMGFFRPRDAGEWREGFNPLAWDDAFSQGSAWQGGWAVPHDPEGLIAALGGPEVALARLDTLLALKPIFVPGPGGETPAMTQMAISNFGQYAHSLAVTHGILWFYPLAGRPEKGERLILKVLDELYSPGVDGYCGDARDGELAAWYVWAALGLYPLCPGSGDYVLGSPLFPRVTVTSGDGATLTIEVTNPGSNNPVVRKRTLGNVVLSDPRVSRVDLFDLGRLVVEKLD